MFSRGTFLRYLYEVDQTHREIADLYGRLAARASDPGLHERITRMADEVRHEKSLVELIRQKLQTAT